MRVLILSFILDDSVCTDPGSLVGSRCLWKGRCLAKVISRERKTEASGRECCAGKTSSSPRGQQGAGAGGRRSPGEGNRADLFVNPSENNRCLQAFSLFPLTFHLRHFSLKSNEIWKRFLIIIYQSIISIHHNPFTKSPRVEGLK